MEEIKCAIYTRKSTDEGLEKEFNTLEAQREAGENYVKSQKHQGWILVDEHYDDGGFSGGNMKRPALQRLFFYSRHLVFRGILLVFRRHSDIGCCLNFLLRLCVIK